MSAFLIFECKRRIAHAITALKELYGTDLTRRMYFTEYPLRNQTSDVSFCAAVLQDSKGEYIKDIPAMDAICIYHDGAYEDLPDVSRKLLLYAKEQKLKPLGVLRHTYLEGSPQHKDKSRFVTQVALPGEKAVS